MAINFFNNLQVNKGYIEIDDGGTANQRGIISYGVNGKIGSTTGWTPDTGGNPGLWVEGSNDGESGGIFMNGNTCALWSPGDQGILKIYDEDSFSQGPVYQITGSGISEGLKFASIYDNTYYLDPDGDSQLNTVDIDDYVRHRGDTNTYVGFPSNDTFTVTTSSIERMRIDSIGRVGIGGTPTHRLYVRNDVAATSDLDPTSIKLYNNNDGGSAIEFSNGVAGNSKLSFGVEGTGGFTDETYIGFSTSVNGASATERMRIGSAGQIGIGGANYGTSGQVLTSSGSSSAPSWQTPTAGGITGVTAGSYMTGGGTSGNVTLNANASTSDTANTLVARDGSGDINVRLLRASYANQSTISGAMAFRVNNGSDNYTRYCSDPAAIRTFIGAGNYNDIRSLGAPAFTNGANPNITTAQVMSEIESDGGFDSYSSVFKTSWSYAGNYNLTDAGDFTETAGSSWITWTDNSSDSTRGNITALAIAPNTGGSAGGVFIYNDQGPTYSPGWRQVWTSATDGAGSGLDADLLDGVQGSSYIRNDVNNVVTPGKQVSFYSNDNIESSSGDQATLEVYQDTSGADAFMQFHVSGDFGAYFGLDGSTNDFAVGGWSMGANKYKVWHAGNDGSGSGLDADLLDGLHATASGNRWGVVPTVGSSGVLEAGKYIDFHDSDSHTGDYNYRISSSPGILYLSGDLEVDGGDIYINDTNTRITEGSSNSIRLQTNSGYVDVGPQNSSHAHFTTDRSSFYFNKEVQVNSGVIRSYDEDLNLNRAGSSTARLRVTSGTTYSDQLFYVSTTGTALRAASSQGEGAIIRGGNNSTNIAEFQNSSGSLKTVINTNGYLAVNRTSADYQIDVSGDIRASTRLRISTYGAFLSVYYSYVTTNSELWVGYGGGSYARCRASAFTVSSDYRLKENLENLENPIERLKELKVYRFNWKDKPDEDKVDGFIAHEVSDVVPDAVAGEKDGIGQGGEPDYQGIDHGKLVPLLTSSLQEAILKIEQLETRIQNLENN
jgi:hypothetical protein